MNIYGSWNTGSPSCGINWIIWGENTVRLGSKSLPCCTDFPPLNYCCYPAVPAKYIVPIDDPWSPSLEALEVMEELAEEAGDQSFQKILKSIQALSGAAIQPLDWKTAEKKEDMHPL